MNKAALNTMELVDQPGQVPDWVQLLPAGKMVGRDGRSWNNNQPKKVMESFAALARDIPIDIEHSTELKGPQGEPAPAVGWIKELDVRDGAIWGRAEWNAAGSQLVGDQAYRYISPVILYQPGNGTIVGITSVAVTNQPNLMLPALNQQQESEQLTKENRMVKALLAALALPETATEAEALAKINTIQTDLASARNRAENPSLEKFVPRGDFDAALEKAANAERELATIKKEGLDAAINQAIDGALKEGKITPATAEYHRAQCSQEGGLDRFKAYCAAAPVIGGDSGLDKKNPDKESKALNAEQQQIATMFGNSAEDLDKYGK